MMDLGLTPITIALILLAVVWAIGFICGLIASAIWRAGRAESDETDRAGA